MNESQHVAGVTIRNLGLKVSFLEPGRDNPTLSVLIDGRSVLEKAASTGYIGFEPDSILTESDALVPLDRPRRVAIYSCSCGEPGCGVVAPVISTDGDIVRWSDFRDFTGVFASPTIDEWEEREYAGTEDGSALEVEEIFFDREQYMAEVRRATSDRSWESPGRRTARLVSRSLRRQPGVFEDDGVEFGWFLYEWWRSSPPVWSIEVHTRGTRARQYLSEISATPSTPERQSVEILTRLRAMSPLKWPEAFPTSDPQ